MDYLSLGVEYQTYFSMNFSIVLEFWVYPYNISLILNNTM